MTAFTFGGEAWTSSSSPFTQALHERRCEARATFRQPRRMCIYGVLEEVRVTLQYDCVEPLPETIS